MDRDEKRRTRTLVSALLLLLPAWSLADDQATPLPRWVVVHPAGDPFAAALEPLVAQRKSQQLDVRLLEAGDAWEDQVAQACTSKGAVYLLLAGSWEKDAAAHIPMLRGKHGRMQGQLTDYPYGDAKPTGAPRIAVGRLPARSADELRILVEKTLRLEQSSWGAAAYRLSLLVGHPGGHSSFERRLGESIVNHAANQRLSQLHPLWRADCLVDMPGTVFSAPGEFRQSMITRLCQPYLFSCFAGHSNARGIWTSEGGVSREQLASLRSKHPPGIWVSCGCFGCQLDGADGPGYCVAAIRSKGGPAAVIGALSESYAAGGLLTLDGFATCLAKARPPARLGDYYLAMQKGLAEGPMSWLTFQLYDYGDGSGGSVPLADQRREHLEMWALFGDPALRLPFPVADLELSVSGDLQPNSEVEVRVAGLRLPAGADIELIAESRDAGAHSRPRFGATLARATARSDGDSLRMQCQLPDKLPQQLLFRVTATDGKQTQLGLHLVVFSTNP